MRALLIALVCVTLPFAAVARTMDAIKIPCPMQPARSGHGAECAVSDRHLLQRCGHHRQNRQALQGGAGMPNLPCRHAVAADGDIGTQPVFPDSGARADRSQAPPRRYLATASPDLTPLPVPLRPAPRGYSE